MKIGMLWFDDDPRRGLDEKVLRAVSYYQQKYGQKPTVCYVHPTALQPGAKEAQGQPTSVQIRSAPNVLPHHFWVGNAEA